MSDDQPTRPRSPIRRFDVFAEFQRVQNQERGMKAAQAKGRAIWAAKVVAGRGGRGGNTGSKSADGAAGEHRDRGDRQEEDEEFRSAGGELQTDATFDREIVDRMGSDFYHHVFRPAIEQAHAAGQQYTDIRDSIRTNWK